MLEQTARASVRDQRGGPQWLSERPEVDDWGDALRDEWSPTWLATIDDVPVGYLRMHVRPAGIAEVESVFVLEEARELGFGEGLLDAAIEYACDHSCTAIEASALPGDRATKNLYERAGIVARRIVVSRPLPVRRLSSG